jgi:hypothetical protein
MTSNVPPWLVPIKEQQGDKLTLVEFKIDPKKANIVRQIYEMAGEGESLEGITKYFNGSKIAPITGAKFWRRQQVQRILRSKAVVGVHEPMETTYERDEKDYLKKIKTSMGEIPDYFPAIIEENLANKVWSLNKTRSAYKKTGKISFVTSGLARCFKCSHSMTYSTKNSKASPSGKYRYLVCQNSRIRVCSERKMIKYDLIEGILLHELADVLEMHSPQGEADELTNLKGAVVEIEDGVSRLVDAIRFRGHDASIGQALDQLERERRAIDGPTDRSQP